MRWQQHHGILTPVAALSGSSYSAEAVTLFAAMDVQPDAARKAIIDTAIVALKAAGIWSQLDLLYFLAAHDEQAGRVNWVKPGSFTALAINSPTFATDRGFTGNGSSSRLRTQFTPSTSATQYSKDNASLWTWVVTNVTENTYDVGTVSAPYAAIRSKSSTNNLRGTVNSGTNSDFGIVATSVGFSGVSRASSSSEKAWKNGAQSGSASATNSTAITSSELWICGANNSSFSTRQIGVMACGAALTGLESTFYQIALTYMQGVGAA